MEEKCYTVNEVAKLKEITIRKLHYYDQIGLLKPDKRSEAGYRLYGQAKLECLNKILYYQELNFPLKEIPSLLKDTMDRTSMLRNQLLLMNERHQHLSEQIERIMNAIAVLEAPDLYIPWFCDKHEDMCLFADKEVKKGELVYSRITPRLIFDIEQEQYDTLNLKPSTERYIRENSFWDEEELHIDCDALPFIHHSNKPNVIQDINHSDINLIASQDIKSGSEITR